MSVLRDKLILIGGGGHCRSCIDVIEAENRYSIVGILDQSENVGTVVLGYKVLGDDSDVAKYVVQGCFFLITVGQIKSASLREKLYRLVLKEKGKFATIISPRAYIAESASIAQGSIVMHDALINVNSVIGENCIINSKALIEHDCHIHAHCHISTAAVINGGVTVGHSSFFGSNAVSQQGGDIKAQSFIKANSCFIGHERKKIAFLTTIFPTNLNYIIEFFESLSRQTVNYFDLIVLNDGYCGFDKIKKQFTELHIIELPAAGGIAKNRQALIQFSKVNYYDIAIFGDIDDTFTDDRIEKSIKALRHADIIVNDVTAVKDGQIIDKQLYSHRLTDQQWIAFDFIKDKNIFGLSNTALNLQVVPLDLIDFPEQLIAVDWYFFTLLLLNGAKARFIADTATFYRQYDTNVIGIGPFTAEKIRSILAVKMVHYQQMQPFASEFKALLDETRLLKEQVENESILNRLLTDNGNKIKYPLWWELTDFRNENENNREDNNC